MVATNVRKGVAEPVAIRRLCAICAAPRATTPHLMTHGVVVHLCSVHGDLNYLRRDGGHRFARRLMEIWAAHDVLTWKRRAAIRAHIARIRRTATNELPGSYAWKAQRKHAEARFAKGDAPNEVIDDVRDPHHFAGHPPSVRTIRRWLADGRWLTPKAPGIVESVAGAVVGVLDLLDAIDRESRRLWHTDDRWSVQDRRLTARMRSHGFG